MTNKPWYIWFSIFAFLVLWSDTTRKLKYTREYLGLWYRATGNLLKLSCVYILFIPIASTMLLGYLAEGLSRLLSIEVSNQYIVDNIFASIIFIFIYFGGVYATYRHALWRREHI